VQNEIDTIVAQATPKGRGGVGIVRISGSLAPKIAKQLLKRIPIVRQGEFLPFLNEGGEVIDQGIALFFKGPHSFTGEDVLELQGHGGPVIMDNLVNAAITQGARLAGPGEFSLRAFMNNKMDLVQAEAVADLINANSEKAARSAMRSLQGDFSKAIHTLVETLTHLRMFIESAIDFPDEEIDFLNHEKISIQLDHLNKAVLGIQQKAQQGALLQEGIKVVIIGRPNAGKSSLLNALTGSDRAIVTDIPGTTRDVLRESISLEGLLVELVDTAGLRLEADIIEEEGIRRALKEVALADQIIFVIDKSSTDNVDLKTLFPEWIEKFPTGVPITILANKIDKLNLPTTITHLPHATMIDVSAKTGDGISLVRAHLKKVAGFSENTEGCFLARRRHLLALSVALKHIQDGKKQLEIAKALELVAEELRQAQLALGEITGKVSSDDLLGKIFSEFCIGK
jgi:tRNA modification GTPase